MKNGPYELVLAPKKYPGKKYRDKYCYEHHKVWWLKKGSVPAKGYEIHHIDGNHRNNKISNLRLLTSNEHKKIHNELSKKKSSYEYKCGFCLMSKQISISRYKTRIKRNKSNLLFCSRSCGTKYQFRKNKKN